MKISTQRWCEIQNGYGLWKLPRELAIQSYCQICLQEGGHLWSDAPGPPNNMLNLKQYSEWVERVRRNSWCKHHAIEYHT